MKEDKYDCIDKLIYSNIAEHSISFILAPIFVEKLENNFKKVERPLLSKLATTDEPFNDYGKEKVSKHLQAALN